MEFRELNTFLEITRLGSFCRAAEHLGYSQAAVTVQIKNLERELGVRLFDRIGKQISLTHQGTLFLEHAKRLTKDLAEAKSAVAENDEPCGCLSIGTIESICASILPDVLARCHTLHPKMTVSVATDSPDQLLDQMNQNALDIVYFLDKKIYDPRWVKALERPDEAIFVTSATSPFAGKCFSLNEIVCLPFLLTEKNASYRSLLEQRLASENLEIHPFLEIGSTEFIIHMLKTIPCVSFLPQFCVRKDIAQGLLTPIHVPEFHMTIWHQIVYHKDKWVSREMGEFIRMVERMCF